MTNKIVSILPYVCMVPLLQTLGYRMMSELNACRNTTHACNPLWQLLMGADNCQRLNLMSLFSPDSCASWRTFSLEPSISGLALLWRSPMPYGGVYADYPIT